MADTSPETIAACQLAHGSKYPYDGGDQAAQAIDWAHAAARGILADLLDRRGVKWELEKVDQDVRVDIVTALADIIRVAAPSPSTAPEVGERAAFEAWHRSKFATKHSTGQPTRDMHNGIYAEQYGPVHQQQMWEAWQASALASRPAEVHDDPPQWWHELQAAAEALDDAGAVLNAESVRRISEQYRQGQRDAVAADRARRGGRP